MQLTWRAYMDYVGRLIPYLIKHRAMRVTQADVDALQKPLMIPKEK